ncbi:serpin [Alphaentomopoxvirus acuprea]|uniref:Serpin n=1 Tax=Alphaentomopoxvirus acuprea TaxID=62099 RepID=W6JLF2_9POXV|nr:serpin [Anomala cuprea entomopoxvirus]BAO49446.1 serpin [Anomala cuprea entomopoxvirus]
MYKIILIVLTISITISNTRHLTKKNVKHINNLACNMLYDIHNNKSIAIFPIANWYFVKGDETAIEINKKINKIGNRLYILTNGIFNYKTHSIPTINQWLQDSNIHNTKIQVSEFIQTDTLLITIITAKIYLSNILNVYNNKIIVKTTMYYIDFKTDELYINIPIENRLSMIIIYPYYSKNIKLVLKNIHSKKLRSIDKNIKMNNNSDLYIMLPIINDEYKYNLNKMIAEAQHNLFNVNTIEIINISFNYDSNMNETLNDINIMDITTFVYIIYDKKTKLMVSYGIYH